MCFEILRVSELANNLWLVEMESDMVSRWAEVSVVYLSACVAQIPRSISTKLEWVLRNAWIPRAFDVSNACVVIDLARSCCWLSLHCNCVLAVQRTLVLRTFLHHCLHMCFKARGSNPFAPSFSLHFFFLFFRTEGWNTGHPVIKCLVYVDMNWLSCTYSISLNAAS